MQRYKDHQPTGFDPKGAFADKIGEKGDGAEWFVAPVSRPRDCGVLDQSNFTEFLKALGGESETIEVHRFGHWGSGWYEIILIDPADENAVTAAEEMEGALENYPILNEEAYSDAEYMAVCEYWEGMSLRDRIDLCTREGFTCFAARAESPYELDNVAERLQQWVNE